MSENKSVEVLLQLAFFTLTNFGAFAAIIAIYTKVIQKQAKVEFLIKRICHKLDIPTDTEL